LQEIADHREMVAVAGILPLEICEIGVGDIEPLRLPSRDDERRRRLLAQERCGIGDLVNHRILCRAHRRRVRLVQQHRHFAEHSTWLGQGGNDGVTLDHVETSFDQDIEMTGPAALMEHFRAGGDVPPGAADAIFKDVAHRPHLRFRQDVRQD